jgi:hypothetical protein
MVKAGCEPARATLNVCSKQLAQAHEGFDFDLANTFGGNAKFCS